jgi:hypothetical protein
MIARAKAIADSSASSGSSNKPSSEGWLEEVGLPNAGRGTIPGDAEEGDEAAPLHHFERARLDRHPPHDNLTTEGSPLAFVVFLLAGWVSRQQLIVIEYLKAENRMLRKELSYAQLAANAESTGFFRQYNAVAAENDSLQNPADACRQEGRL